eukprot:CAMPEP_0184698554 /NCGR_PEP_ID=MMETSP0313-20130426/5144_1 /TAXON_ID=2792 /ORGANISM="Porphyridium aerugineum, Strain SAG 1380-2" /LENGTH=90 /DNA_ID=CAMNT_0027157517 /DNA_START=400 /DNA_END=672 /DNA_ORIENTATION=+
MTNTSSSPLAVVDDPIHRQHPTETNHHVSDEGVGTNVHISATTEMGHTNNEEIIEEEVVESIEPADVGDNNQTTDAAQDPNAISMEEDLI